MRGAAVKKCMCFLIVLVVTISAITSGCTKKSISRVTIDPLNVKKVEYIQSWQEPVIKASVKPYTIKQDLSNIVNLSKINNLSTADKSDLIKNQFLIKNPGIVFEQPFDLYQKNSEDGIPNFITTDSILHAYHLLHDYIIKNMERERLIDELKEFTQGSFKKSLEVYYGTIDKATKKAALKNVAYFGIAMRLLNMSLPGGIPIEASRIIDNDAKKVKARWSSGTSEIFPYSLDYKKYIVRGHYSRESEFTNYYLALMWYRSTPVLFEQYDDGTGVYRRLDEQIAMSVLMAAQTLGDDNLRRLWDDLYKVTTFYFGKVGDVSIYDMSDIIKVIYGEKVDFNKIWSDNGIQKVYELAKQRYNLHTSETVGGKIYTSVKDNRIQVQFRLMGQMYSLDNDIYNNLTAISSGTSGGSRQLPKGLDIPSALGSDRAYYTIKDESGEDNDWVSYSDSMNRLRSVIGSSKSLTNYSFNNSIYWILMDSVKPYKSGFPSFMLNENYTGKMLITSVSAFSDSKHIIVSNGKSGEDKIPAVNKNAEIPGFIEPDVSLYTKLMYASEYIESFMTVNNFVNTNMYNAINSFKDTVSFLKSVSVKELDNKPLTDEEGNRIRNFAAELKDLMEQVLDGKASQKQWETVTRVDRNMACVADAYINENQVLQTAIGYPDYVYAVVPYNGKLYLARGSIYSYYEFAGTVAKKLKDNEWQSMVADGKEVDQQVWINNIKK
jgi:Protein of unknown function (DUF3160).